MRNLKQIKETTNLFVDKEGYDGFAGRYFDKDSNKMLQYVFSWGGGWEHLSVSLPRKCPTWEQMCKMKEIFYDDEEVCVEYHPRRSDYVNMHQYCLHIWRPIDESIPTPPRNYV